MNDAKHHAERQYAIYDAKRKADRQMEADRNIAALRDAGKSLPTGRKRS